MEITLPIVDILRLLQNHKEPNKAIKKMALSLYDIIQKLLADVETYSENELETLGEIIFSDDDYRTYIEVWENYKLLLLPINNKILLNWLYLYKPGKIKSNYTDIALSWLLNNKYNSYDFKNLSPEDQKNLFDLFNDYDGDIPEEIQEYKNLEHFKNELLIFEDDEFLYNNYTLFKLDKVEAFELLSQIIIGRKLNDPLKLSLFLTIVNWFAPKNQIGRNYFDEFILQLFEVNDDSGIPMWSDASMEMWKEEFYKINFDWESSSMIKNQIDFSIKTEANYISNKLKENPNYRHD